MNAANRPIHDAAATWVQAMLDLLQVAISDQPTMLTELLERDQHQFEALAEHLRMLQSTHTTNSWENYHWALNFSFFLSQLIRNSEQLFQHLAACPEAKQCSVNPCLINDLFGFIRLANRLPNLY